jgi:hypothetical protein
MYRLFLLALATVALGTSSPPAHANVIWTFYETSWTLVIPASGLPCESRSGLIHPYPYALITLTLPGPTSSGTASWIGPGELPVYTGDPFELHYSTTYLTSAFTGISPDFERCVPLQVGGICDFNISWSETAGRLTGVSLQLDGYEDQLGDPPSTFGLTGGLFGSDGLVDNCGNALCLATGFWQSDLPEPMSVSLLASALLGLAVARRLRP